MLRKLLIVVALLLNLSAVAVYLALRDNPSRPTDGERRFARAEGGRIVYYAGGPEDGPAFVMLPSFGRAAADFNELASALGRAGFRTLAVQPRGIDGSTLWVANELHALASDVAAVLVAEGVTEPAVVCGHAYGNRVARSFATRFRPRTRAVVLLAAGGEFPTRPDMTEAIGRGLLGLYPDSMRRDAIARAFFAAGNPVPDSWMRGWYPLAGFVQLRANSTPYDQWGSAGVAPILVVQPAEDAVAPAGGPSLARTYPDRVTLVTVEDAGHALLPEQPEIVAEAVLAYLGALP